MCYITFDSILKQAAVCGWSSALRTLEFKFKIAARIKESFPSPAGPRVSNFFRQASKMPLVSCIIINQCGKRQASFVRRLVNFPDSFARLDKLLELRQHCEQQTSGGWILLTSLPISGSGAARVHLSGTGSQNDIWAGFVEEKLGLGALGRLEGKINCLLVFMVRNIAGESSEPALWHRLFVGLSLDFITVDGGPSQMCQLCLEERQSLGFAESS